MNASDKPVLRERAPFWCRHQDSRGAFDCLAVPLAETDSDLCRPHEEARAAAHDRFWTPARSTVTLPDYSAIEARGRIWPE